MRLFYAVEIPEDIKRNVWREVKKFEDLPVKLVSIHHYHITLLFLGEVEAKNVELLANAIEKNTFPKFYMTLKGMGAFYDKRGAVKVIYKDVGLGREELKEIHEYLTERSGEALESKDRRPYEPHLTLARGAVRSRSVTEAIKERIDQMSGEGGEYKFLVNEILLIRSDLTNHGSEYKLLAKLLLSQ